MPDPSVDQFLVSDPKTLSPDASVGEARADFRSTHVHMVLLVEDDRLVGTLVREDLLDAADDEPALPLAVLEGRTIDASASPGEAMTRLREQGARRMAAVDHRGRLVGLLCLKRRGTGFCTDIDVRQRADGPS